MRRTYRLDAPPTGYWAGSSTNEAGTGMEPSSTDVEGLGARAEQTGDRAWRVTIAGELDAATAPELAAVLDPLVATESPTVVVNLLDVTFMDSSGLRTLVRAANEAKDSGGSLVLARASGAVVRLLEVTGLVDHLPTAEP